MAIPKWMREYLWAKTEMDFSYHTHWADSLSFPRRARAQTSFQQKRLVKICKQHTLSALEHGIRTDYLFSVEIKQPKQN